MFYYINKLKKCTNNTFINYIFSFNCSLFLMIVLIILSLFLSFDLKLCCLFYFFIIIIFYLLFIIIFQLDSVYILFIICQSVQFCCVFNSFFFFINFIANLINLSFDYLNQFSILREHIFNIFNCFYILFRLRIIFIVKFFLFFNCLF